MSSFHIAIHTRPVTARAGAAVQIEGHELVTLIVHTQQPLPPLSVTFEEAAEKLAHLPRMFCEPDGSFVWVAEYGDPAWQVDGQLFDGHGKLAYVELKGMCPESCFNLLLEVFGWPESPLMFQLVRKGLFLPEESFRKLDPFGLHQK